MKKMLITVVVLILILTLTGCDQNQEPQVNETKPELPRVLGADYYYCTGLGYKYEMRIENKHP